MHGAGASNSSVRQHTAQARRVKRTAQARRATAHGAGEGQRKAQAATLDASAKGVDSARRLAPRLSARVDRQAREAPAGLRADSARRRRLEGTAQGAGGERGTAQGAGWCKAGQRKAPGCGNSARRRVGRGGTAQGAGMRRGNWARRRLLRDGARRRV
eukprot:361410-Pleurochrysis_carterae.AAC.1